MNTLDLDLGGATRAKRAEERAMPYPLDDWRYWQERGRREAEHERDVDAQLAAALRCLVAALDDDSAMSGFNWRTYLTRPAYEDDEPCPLADAWAEVARVCPAAPPVYEPAMGTGMYFTPTEIAALAGATDDDEVTP